MATKSNAFSRMGGRAKRLALLYFLTVRLGLELTEEEAGVFFATTHNLSDGFGVVVGSKGYIPKYALHSCRLKKSNPSSDVYILRLTHYMDGRDPWVSLWHQDIINNLSIKELCGIVGSIGPELLHAALTYTKSTSSECLVDWLLY